jgi:hypothetical protein
MNEYLTKPLDKKLLLSMVHKCATTIPVLHPNLNRIMEITPDSEPGNPLDTASWSSPPRETRHNSQSYQEHPLPELRRPLSRGALLCGSSNPV